MALSAVLRAELGLLKQQDTVVVEGHDCLAEEESQAGEERREEHFSKWQQRDHARKLRRDRRRKQRERRRRCNDVQWRARQDRREATIHSTVCVILYMMYAHSTII